MPSTSDDEFQATLAKILHTPLVEGNDIEFLRDGPEIYENKLKAIRNARHSITLEIYEFWGEETAGVFAEALAEQASKGVAVHAIFDFVGSQQAGEEKFTLMRENGVEVIFYRKPEWYRSSRFNFRTHRKLLVVDGQIGFTGGANIGDAWIGEADTRYRDNLFKLTGPIVAYLQSAFLENYSLATGKTLLGKNYFPRLEPQGEQIMQTVISSPREGQKRIRTLLLMLFASAESHIRICTAFFYPDDLLIESLVAARDRGVEVDILAPGENTPEKWVRYASRNRWQPLLENGVRIHEYQPTNIHAKMFIIDEAVVSIGSANFHNRSFRLNDETNVNLFSSSAIQEAITIFTKDLQEARQITLEEWENRPWRENFRGLIGNLIGPHL
ncbi:MAG: hypothetical protein JJT75_01075 [Opitutales bacterium]|nr:hypothetical protein [Opitutales bacterium]MCH8541224.1 phospholipase D-like domain-containing protein [Opitutales bacterium]